MVTKGEIPQNELSSIMGVKLINILQIKFNQISSSNWSSIVIIYKVVWSFLVPPFFHMHTITNKIFTIRECPKIRFEFIVSKTVL